MDENNRKIKQLETLVRLKELKRNKSARKLIDANKQLKLAQTKLSSAEAKYQLLIEMQRKMRQVGSPINPLFYTHQFDAVDSAKISMDREAINWRDKKEDRSLKVAHLTQNFRQLDVARSALLQAINDYDKALEKREIELCFEQQSKNQELEEGWR